MPSNSGYYVIPSVSNGQYWWQNTDATICNAKFWNSNFMEKGGVGSSVFWCHSLIRYVEACCSYIMVGNIALAIQSCRVWHVISLSNSWLFGGFLLAVCWQLTLVIRPSNLTVICNAKCGAPETIRNFCMGFRLHLGRKGCIWGQNSNKEPTLCTDSLRQTNRIAITIVYLCVRVAKIFQIILNYVTKNRFISYFICMVDQK